LFKDFCQQLSRLVLKRFGMEPAVKRLRVTPDDFVNRINNPVWHIDTHQENNRLYAAVNKTFVLAVLFKNFLSELSIEYSTIDTFFDFTRRLRILDKNMVWHEYGGLMDKSLTIWLLDEKFANLERLVNDLNLCERLFYNSKTKTTAGIEYNLNQYIRCKELIKDEMYDVMPFIADTIADEIRRKVKEIFENNIRVFTIGSYSISYGVETLAQIQEFTKDLDGDGNTYIFVYDENALSYDSNKYCMSFVQKDNSVEGKLTVLTPKQKQPNINIIKYVPMDIVFVDNDIKTVIRNLLLGKSVVFGNDKYVFVYENDSLKWTDTINIHDILANEYEVQRG